MYNIIKISIIILLLDCIFIYTIKDYFKNQIEIVQNSEIKINILTTIICYLIIIFGFYYFVILKNYDYKDAFLLGFFIYSVFETTNMSLFKNWKYFTVLIDSIWGGILFSGTLYLYKKISI